LRISSHTHQLNESEGNVVDIVTRLWTERPRIRIVAKENFFSSKSSRIFLGTIPSSNSRGTGVCSVGQNGWAVKLTADFHLVPTLRMS